MTEVWQELGLTDAEYEKIIELLGREPNYTELSMFSVMWSEHCSYKNSRPVLKNFPGGGPQVLQGPGENAGIVDIGDGLGIAFKIESHNHPSAIEPFQGAATGVGGIIRDIFTMGARPIALLNSLRFGSLESDRVKFLFNGVVSGIGWYGNCIGIPTVAGEVYFNDCYAGNPLVNAMCVGLLEHKDIKRGTASGVGNPVMAVGTRTGRDGIHGATFASEELGDESEDKRPSVQVGDPFMEKLLLEACLELIKSGAVVGMQDMGAAGLTSSSCEMATRGGSGMIIDVARVPRREEGMKPYEVLLSESQERMLVIPKKGKEKLVEEIFAKWGLEAAVIGEVTDDGNLTIKNGEETVAVVPATALTEACPVNEPDSKKPEYLSRATEFSVESLPEPADYNETLLRLLAAPTIASKEWVYRQYDYMVRTNTVVGPGSDAAVLRIKGTKKGVAVTTDCNSLYCYLDPFTGGAIAVAEAARNLVCSGAKPLAVTDCLNFGNPEKPEIFWQFKEAVAGMSEACRVLSTPVVSGNVSFYNETSGRAVYPTPVVGMVGLVEDIEQRCTMGFNSEGDLIYLLGETKAELGGSQYLSVIHGRDAGKVPELDLGREARVQRCCLDAIKAGIINSAHDCAEGGMAVALAECAISGGKGFVADLEGNLTVRELLFSESQSRIVVSLAPAEEKNLLTLAEKHGIPCEKVGRVTGESLRISVRANEVIGIPLGQATTTWREAIECMLS